MGLSRIKFVQECSWSRHIVFYMSSNDNKQVGFCTSFSSNFLVLFHEIVKFCVQYVKAIPRSIEVILPPIYLKIYLVCETVILTYILTLFFFFLFFGSLTTFSIPTILKGRELLVLIWNNYVLNYVLSRLLRLLASRADSRYIVVKLLNILSQCYNYNIFFNNYNLSINIQL